MTSIQLPTSGTMSTSATQSRQVRAGSFSSSSTSSFEPVLNVESIPDTIKGMQYAVRGPIVTRANEIELMKNKRPESFPQFERVLYANIGNPQRTGQPPVTYIRQLLASMVYPEMLEGEAAREMPSDILKRAKRWVAAAGGSVGCYSASKGVPLFRDEVADWFEKRDGHRADPESVLLTDGASSGVKMMLELLISCPNDGILVPVPEYPLYSASITRLNGKLIPYYLDERNGWALHPETLRRACAEARAQGIHPKGLVVINPGNPTGALLPRGVMECVVNVCEEENLLLIADEVYQTNIYTSGGPDVDFVSFRKLICERKSQVQIASLHSASKGLFGECGLRGGILQLQNVSADVISILYKLASVSLCANVVGQATVTAIVSPPSQCDPSYAQFQRETGKIYGALKRKAELATKYLNSVPGLSCQAITGALYAYPSLKMPEAALLKAKQLGVAADLLFCFELLDQTGIVCVPGSGFGQAAGTWHLRLTILPDEADFEPLLRKLVTFYQTFCNKYSITSPLSCISTNVPSPAEKSDAAECPPVETDYSTTGDDDSSS